MKYPSSYISYLRVCSLILHMIFKGYTLIFNVSILILSILWTYYHCLHVTQSLCYCSNYVILFDLTLSSRVHSVKVATSFVYPVHFHDILNDSQQTLSFPKFAGLYPFENHLLKILKFDYNQMLSNFFDSTTLSYRYYRINL